MIKIAGLKSNLEFERIFSRGRLIKNESFVMYRIPGRQKRVRIGICVGRSLGNAVIRNRLKRQIREIIRKLELKGDHFDAVLVARKNIVGSDFNRIKNAIERLFLKALLL